MDKKIEILICVGTYSYVMGAAELVNIEEELPEELRDKVDVRGVIDIEGCSPENNSKPPYASVNGKPIEEATVEKIITEIRSLV